MPGCLQSPVNIRREPQTQNSRAICSQSVPCQFYSLLCSKSILFSKLLSISWHLVLQFVTVSYRLQFLLKSYKQFLMRGKNLKEMDREEVKAWKWVGERQLWDE